MRYWTPACVLSVLFTSLPVLAQAPPAAQPELVPPPAWAANDLACAPALQPESRGDDQARPLRVIGAQHTSQRTLMGPPDLLVVSGGSNAGLEPGQRYFVRRVVTSPHNMPTVHTAGWVQILGVDTTVATATIVNVCDGILRDDYLEPYVAPMIAAAPVPGTSPQYENMGHIVTGIEGQHTAGAGNYMTIDRGGNAGVVVGQRFLVFRDMRGERVETTGRSEAFKTTSRNMPLVEVGAVLVVAVRPEDSTVQVLTSKDAIVHGDLIAPIR